MPLESSESQILLKFDIALREWRGVGRRRGREEEREEGRQDVKEEEDEGGEVEARDTEGRDEGCVERVEDEGQGLAR